MKSFQCTCWRGNEWRIVSSCLGKRSRAGKWHQRPVDSNLGVDRDISTMEAQAIDPRTQNERAKQDVVWTKPASRGMFWWRNASGDAPCRLPLKREW